VKVFGQSKEIFIFFLPKNKMNNHDKNTPGPSERQRLTKKVQEKTMKKKKEYSRTLWVVKKIIAITYRTSLIKKPIRMIQTKDNIKKATLKATEKTADHIVKLLKHEISVHPCPTRYGKNTLKNQIYCQ
jgi:hypothetical protein